jgi:hypothetical protein
MPVHWFIPMFSTIATTVRPSQSSEPPDTASPTTIITPAKEKAQKDLTIN